jgi:hypothetical protein
MCRTGLSVPYRPVREGPNLRRTDDKGLPCPPFSRQPFASSSPCAQGRDAESHPTPRGKRHIASLSGRPAFTSDALSCPLRPNDAGRPDRRGTSSGGHRPSNPATRQWCASSSNPRNEPESIRRLSTHQDVGRFGGATGSARAVGLASMFLPPGSQRDCACAYSLTRARPGSYRDRIKPSVCATPAPAVMRHASSPLGARCAPPPASPTVIDTRRQRRAERGCTGS